MRKQEQGLMSRIPEPVVIPVLSRGAGTRDHSNTLGSAASASGQTPLLLEQLEGIEVFLLLSWIRLAQRRCSKATRARTFRVSQQNNEAK